MTPVVIHTLGDLVAHDMDITASCDNPDCRRDLDLNAAKLIEAFGPDQTYCKSHPPVRCASCGSRKIRWNVMNLRNGDGGNDLFRKAWYGDREAGERET